MWQEPKIIPDLLKRNVVDFPGRPALTAVSSSTGLWTSRSWSEIDLATDRLAAGLSRCGVTRSRKVAFLNDNCLECYLAYLAVQKLGAVFVPVNYRLVEREVLALLSDSDTECLIVGLEYHRQLRKGLATLQGLRSVVVIEGPGRPAPGDTVSFSELIEYSPDRPAVDLSAAAVADIVYTTGTTGAPKGVLLTHANKIACGRMLGATWGVRRKHYRQTILQNSYPFFTSTGVSSILMPWLYYGFTVILEQKFDVSQTLKTAERFKTTMYCGTPAMFIFLLDSSEIEDRDTSALDSLYSGGSALSADTVKKMRRQWPGARIYNIYGLTEGGTGGTCLDAADIERKPNSIGLPWAPDQEMRILNDKGEDAAEHEVGEFIMRGPNVMQGYYKNQTETRKVLQNGWLHTGDMGYYDRDGYFFFTDRKKDVVVRGGFNVYSIEVENAIYEHGAVKHCAVVSKPHPKLGEDLLAFVVVAQGCRLTGAELAAFLRDKLADYKRPRDIRFVDRLPANSMGKIDKKALRSQIFSSAEKMKGQDV